MTMKRRDFIKDLSLVVASLVFVPLGTIQGREILLTEKEENTKLKVFDQVILPANPKMYTSLYFLDCCGDKDIKLLSPGQNINGQGQQTIALKKNRNYQVQYLGKFYGWSVI